MVSGRLLYRLITDLLNSGINIETKPLTRNNKKSKLATVPETARIR